MGALARTFVPYIVKIKENPKIKWDNNYLKPALAGIILALIIATLMANQVQDVGLLSGFTLAYTLHSLSREVQKSLV